MSILSVVLGLLAAVIVYVVLTSFIAVIPVLLSGLIALVVFFLVASTATSWPVFKR